MLGTRYLNIKMYAVYWIRTGFQTICDGTNHSCSPARAHVKTLDSHLNIYGEDRIFNCKNKKTKTVLTGGRH